MSTTDVIARTESFIRENFLYTRPDFDLRPNLPLLGEGIIDSMGAVELIEFLQATFGIVMRDDEITEMNLGTLEAIAALVERKRSVADDGLVAA